MIDRVARDALALLVRRLGSGRLRTLKFDRLAFQIESRDPAIDAVRTQLWGCYDDFCDTRLQVDRDGRRVLSKMVLFLRSDQAFRAAKKPKWHIPGSDADYWPFDSSAALDEARQHERGMRGEPSRSPRA